VKRILLAISLLLVLPAPVSAEEPAQPAAEGAPHTIEVVAAGAPATLAAMAERIRSLESHLPVAVRWTERPAIDVREIVAQPNAQARAPQDQEVFARVWLDLSHSERAVLFISNARQDRILVRVMPASGGYGELTRESLATVVESAIDALLAGGQIGVERSAAVREIETQTGTRVITEVPPTPKVVVAPEPEPVQVLPPTSSAPHASGMVSAQYRGDAIASGLSTKHGLQLALSWTGFFEPALDLLLAVTGMYFPPFGLGEQGRRVTEHGGGARAAIGATGKQGILVWQAALGAGVDVAQITPVIGPKTGLVEAEPFRITRPVGTLFVSCALRPAAWLEIPVGAGLDLDFSGHHFDIQSADSRTAAVSPWRIHPYWFVGIGMPLGRNR
jgi:hypothetical protein